MSVDKAGYSRGVGYIDAAKQVLKSAKRPLTCREIADRAIERGLLNTTAKTPQNTFHALLSRHIREYGKSSGFKKAGRGLFDLADR